MGSYELVLQLIYDSIGEVNEVVEPEQALEKSPATVLLGEAGKLESLGFVTLIAAVEQKVDRTFHRQISLIDFMVPAERNEWTVANLAKCIAEMVDGDARNQPSPQLSAQM